MSNEWMAVLFLACLALAGSADPNEADEPEPVVVRVKQGVMRGSAGVSERGKTFYTFSGIPYAKPPLGRLRFKLPEKAGEWEGTLDATKWKKCLQSAQWMGRDETAGEEDCLALNVHTDQIYLPRELKPVMVFIHGGGYLVGDGGIDFYGAEWFMDYDVVLVTVNYRLGPFGFLSMGDEVIQGNQGLWDQRLALEWVRDNIAAFGGDPNKVTIFGESAGGMSVMHHVLSQQSLGLFHGAVMQSGALPSSFVRVDKHPAYHGRSFAAAMGCSPEASSEDILTCLQNVKDAKSLLHEDFNQIIFEPNSFIFKPVVDSYSSTPFLAADPLELIKKGHFNKVPMIIGNNKDEGLVFTELLRAKMPHLLPLLETDQWEELFSFWLFKRDSDELDQGCKHAAKLILDEVFGGRYNASQFHKFTQLFGDSVFNVAGTNTARILARKNREPVYEYRYNYAGSMTFLSLQGPWTIPMILARTMARKIGFDLFANEEGIATHVDELFLIFNSHKIPLETAYTPRDKAVGEKLLTLWTNFAKHGGDPTPKGASYTGDKWGPVRTGQYSVHLEFTPAGDTRLGTDDEDYKKRLDLWERVHKSCPPTMHYYESKTFKDTKMYRRSSRPDGDKTEL